LMDKARGPGLVSRVAVGPAAGWCLSGGVACARVRSKLFMKDQKRKVHMAHKLSIGDSRAAAKAVCRLSFNE